jgi:hypothetical protein
MQAIIINPHTRTVTKQAIPDGLEGLYETMRCDTVTALDVGAGLTLWLDDEGLFKESQKFFELGKYPDPLAGIAVILSTTQDGDSVDVDERLTIEMVEREVRFIELEEYPEPRFEFFAF